MFRLVADDGSTVQRSWCRLSELGWALGTACGGAWRGSLDGKVRMASSHTCLATCCCVCSARANLHSSTALPLVFFPPTSAGLNCDIPRLTSPASPYLRHQLAADQLPHHRIYIHLSDVTPRHHIKQHLSNTAKANMSGIREKLKRKLSMHDKNGMNAAFLHVRM